MAGIVDTIKRNTDDLVFASKSIGLEENADKTKYIVISRDQNTAQKSHDIKIDKSLSIRWNN